MSNVSVTSLFFMVVHSLYIYSVTTSFQITHFTVKGIKLACRNRTSYIAGKPTIVGLQKPLRPFVKNALGNACVPTQLVNSLFNAQAI